ncbi:hypothetical protein TIFTF001_001530 [Ficus carica]|uniref:Uncharacterized protein n=1 Tax=Ficus carica TaxID=3494 RepID=A0AA87Z206_FICCA|nr:hypothetical protein TIFTF001_001530 [Ficus carica]
MAADGNTRGSIAFFTTYRPPLPLDIFSCPIPTKGDELPMTDGQSYNYNGHFIPPTALKTILKSLNLASKGTFIDSDVDSGQLLGIVFVSERDNLETLHIALLFRGNTTTPVVVEPKVQVFSLAQVFGITEFHGVRMEDSGCFSSDYIFYVTTKDPAPSRRQPWTAVYKTHFITGNTERLTPPGSFPHLD